MTHLFPIPFERCLGPLSVGFVPAFKDYDITRETHMKKMATTKLYRSPCRFNFSTMLWPGLSLFSVRALPRLVLSR